jgi:hypothetical protein
MLFSTKNGHATKVAEAPVGKNNQGVTFTPNGKYILHAKLCQERIGGVPNDRSGQWRTLR